MDADITSDCTCVPMYASARAHGLRNEIGIVLAAAQVLDASDPELASDLRTAGRSLQVDVERIVAGSRLAVPAHRVAEPIPLVDLVSAAARRIRREGLTTGLRCSAGGDVELIGPPRLAERVVADVVHLLVAAAVDDVAEVVVAAARRSGGGIELAAAAVGPARRATDAAALQQLERSELWGLVACCAAGCGLRLRRAGTGLRLASPEVAASAHA